MKKSMQLIGGALLVGSLVLFTGCGKDSQQTPQSGTTDPVPTTTTEGVVIDIPDDSILKLDNDKGGSLLIDDMEAGRIPTTCTVLYDEEGGRPMVTVTDPDTITELYKRFSQMTVGKRTNMSVTDCYHFISFTLQDDTSVGWNFESEDFLVWTGGNYEVVDNGNLWELARQLQDEQMKQ